MGIKAIVRKLRRRVLFTSNGYFPQIPTHLGFEYLGSEYGGWPVLPSLLGKGSVVLSFGLGEDISFDREVIARFGCRVFGFDPTPKSSRWIAEQDLPSQFQYFAVGLAGHDGEISFHAPANENHASYSAVQTVSTAAEAVVLQVKKLSTFVAELNLKKIDVLKMDIEGSENEVIEDLANGDIMPSQLLVEFHHRIHRSSFSKTKRAIRNLESLGYQLFYISDLGDEYAFVHRSQLSPT